jgi:hypothetical protein
MKIDRVILAVDNNPAYAVYWNIVSKVWKEKFNIEPTLIFHGSNLEFESQNFNIDTFDYKIIPHIPELSDPKPNWVVPWSLFWGASQYKNEVCLLSGIDQIPICDIFFKKIINIEDNKFIVGFADAYKKYNQHTLGYFNTQTNVLYPSSHLVGKGKKFKEIFQIENNFEVEAIKVFNSKERYYLNNNFYPSSKLWGLDECYASEKISTYNDQKDIIELNLFWDYWIPNRIDIHTPNVNFDLNLVKSGYYSEVTCKNYDQYKDKINLIIENIPKIQYI